MTKCLNLSITALLLILPSFVHAQSPKNYQTTINGPLKKWAQTFLNFKLSDFKNKTPAQKFENTNPVKRKNKTTFYPSYKAALSTSPNGAYTLNIYSYLLLEKKNGKFMTTGSDVEQNILLGHIQDGGWKQIAYYGYTQRVQEVAWIDNNTFILAAARLNKAGKNLPVIIVGQIKQQSLITFETTNTKCYQNPAGYISPKLTLLLHSEPKS
ncbi:hypothetical protein [Mucilaginibacter sp. SG564]|uniref:hypothetical protein n=1 Tax=Mucilaginibacter sp. SG564 TaxID=2587022 RepID=UPI001557C9E7|nr:hypothetical protein [Mucilaginibacter sp. SG564]NOW94800.1 hypothetical protein [Mucilaginibacter sp. SG564]